jgi:signal transduction histidine kinase
MDVQDHERRRLEQELDQGAQQLVVSLKVKLDVAGRIARKEGADKLADLLEGMGSDARDAVKQIRSLARGLYPPLLQAEGLVTAVRSIAEVSPVPVEVDANEIGRFSPELEATVFFCISEAITNGAKHASGSPLLVRLRESDGILTFEVIDRGPGFDVSTAKSGSGLHNMADRLDGVGGTLEIVSAPGHGTSIRGSVPLTEHELVASGVGHPAI